MRIMNALSLFIYVHKNVGMQAISPYISIQILIILAQMRTNFLQDLNSSSQLMFVC